MYLKETYYCSLHLRKNGENVSGKTPILNIMRNSDYKYLKPSTGNWNVSANDIELIEVAPGIYQYSLDISSFYDSPESYTLIYKYNNYVQSEQVLFERKNRARLV